MWEFEFEATDITDKAIIDLIRTQNGEIIGVGFDEGFENYEGYGGWIFKATANGEFLWENSIPSPNPSFNRGAFYSVEETEDKGFIISGYLLDTIPGVPNIANPNIWLVKLDSLGCIEESTCSNGPTNPVFSPQKEYEINIFPNPVHNTLYLTGNNDYQQLEVFDTFGKLILNAENVTELNCSDLPSGTYIIKAYNKPYEQPFISRFVKL